MITMTDQSNVAVPTFVASALRFSDDPPAMKGFLEVLGLSVEISKDNGWFTLKGRSGEVALHASRAQSASNAPGGRTGLVLITPDARAAAESLETQGLSARHWDEAFGVQAMVRSPGGREISINEVQNDLYGYEKHDPRPGPIDVVVVYFSDDLDAAARFFQRFGFEPDEDGSEGCHALRNGDRGVINLHRASDGQDEGSVGLSFETDEPLTAVADRLRAAGYDPSLEDQPQRVAVTDPDGLIIEIWPTPGSAG